MFFFLCSREILFFFLDCQLLLRLFWFNNVQEFNGFFSLCLGNVMSTQMPEKAGNFSWFLRSNPVVNGWFKVLVMTVFFGILIVWGIDGLVLGNLQRDFVLLRFNSTNRLAQDLKSLSFSDIPLRPVSEESYVNLNHTLLDLVKTHENLTPVSAPSNSARKQLNVTNITNPFLPESKTKKDQHLKDSAKSSVLPWISAELEENYSSKVLNGWLAPGGEPCKDSRTVDIRIPGLDGLDNSIELSTGDIHEFSFQAVDESGKPHCLGGDYFEIDLSSETWKSRPPIKDFGNGTYKFSLQVHQDYQGTYNLTIILLFRHYEGLKFSTKRFAFDRVLRDIPVKFRRSSAQLPEISQCNKSDFVRDVWSGRWTRHAKNDSCAISKDGRYRCQEPKFPCQHPWCNGPLGLLESNGWVYSAHCSFKMFTSKQAWNCLNNRWIFWWGDSNHCDTIRNILNFILDVKDINVVPRRFDMNITNPKNPSQVFRFTSIFNGHWNASGNYLGLNSLENADYRELLKGYFSQEVVPDTLIMNSGLHDGIYWPNLRRFINGADYAAKFWSEILEGVKKRGLAPPEVVYRTTVTTGGYARSMAFNPHKMEVFNGVVIEKMRKYNVINRVIDDFDMTFPWHYDNRANDGVHYGRAPAKMRWRDGQIGHQYFLDLMLGHVLLNTLCTR